MQGVYDHDTEILLEAYRAVGVNVRRGRNSLVTRREVEQASLVPVTIEEEVQEEQESGDLDEWDAWGILQDIDTQWGMLPQGGAYKESNHYWGPGRYDCY